jgi:hypothetical protein
MGHLCSMRVTQLLFLLPAKSSALSTVSSTVSATLNALYPAAAYNARRQEARSAALATSTIKSTEGVPLAGDASTYGEFDLSFFAELLQSASPKPGDTFLDLGSGVGRLVVGAALLHPDTWSNCHGIELSAPLHERAIEARYAFEELPSPRPPIAPCEYTCGDVLGVEAATALGASAVCFSYAVTWAREKGAHTALSRALASSLRPGSRVISIDLKLSNEIAEEENRHFALLHQLEGENAETGACTGWVYEVRSGLREE